MATLKSNLIPASDNGGDRIVDGAKVSGDLLLAEARYTLTGSEAADDVLQLVKLPEGARIIPGLSKVVCDDPGTTLTVDIGDDDTTPDPDRYADGIALSAGGEIGFGFAGAAAKVPHTLDKQSTISAKFATVSSLSADARLTFLIVYAAQS